MCYKKDLSKSLKAPLYIVPYNRFISREFHFLEEHEFYKNKTFRFLCNFKQPRSAPANGWHALQNTTSTTCHTCVSTKQKLNL